MYIIKVIETNAVQNAFVEHSESTAIHLTRRLLHQLSREFDITCACGPRISRESKRACLSRIMKIAEELRSMISFTSNKWGESVGGSIATEVVSWFQFRLPRSLKVHYHRTDESGRWEVDSTTTKSEWTLPSNLNFLKGEVPLQGPISAHDFQAWRLRTILSLFMLVVTEMNQCSVHSHLHSDKCFVDHVSG
jgi:hypothetical protein